jgi:hypothetical protein
MKGAWAQLPVLPTCSGVFKNLVGAVKDAPVFSPRALVETTGGVQKLLPEEWSKL